MTRERRDLVIGVSVGLAVVLVMYLLEHWR